MSLYDDKGGRVSYIFEHMSIGALRVVGEGTSRSRLRACVTSLSGGLRASVHRLAQPVRIDLTDSGRYFHGRAIVCAACGKDHLGVSCGLPGRATCFLTCPGVIRAARAAREKTIGDHECLVQAGFRADARFGRMPGTDSRHASGVTR